MREETLLEQRGIRPGDLVRHFKRETLSAEERKTNRYLYRVLCVAQHTETREALVVYEALYGDFGIFARPLSMFAGEVDRRKYPDIRQRYRFEKVCQGEEPTPGSPEFNLASVDKRGAEC